MFAIRSHLNCNIIYSGGGGPLGKGGLLGGGVDGNGGCWGAWYRFGMKYGLEL